MTDLAVLSDNLGEGGSGNVGGGRGVARGRSGIRGVADGQSADRGRGIREKTASARADDQSDAQGGRGARRCIHSVASGLPTCAAGPDRPVDATSG